MNTTMNSRSTLVPDVPLPLAGKHIPDQIEVRVELDAITSEEVDMEAEARDHHHGDRPASNDLRAWRG